MGKLDLKWMRYSGRLSGAVLTKALLLYLGYLGGAWLDRRLGTAPFLTFFGLVAAAALGMWYVIGVARRG